MYKPILIRSAKKLIKMRNANIIETMTDGCTISITQGASVPRVHLYTYLLQHFIISVQVTGNKQNIRKPLIRKIRQDKWVLCISCFKTSVCNIRDRQVGSWEIPKKHLPIRAYFAVLFFVFSGRASSEFIKTQTWLSDKHFISSKGFLLHFWIVCNQVSWILFKINTISK